MEWPSQRPDLNPTESGLRLVHTGRVVRRPARIMPEVIKLLNAVIIAVQRMFLVLFSQYSVQVFYFSFLNNVYKFLLYS